LKTVFDDGIVVVRQARVNDQIGDGGEAAEPTGVIAPIIELSVRSRYHSSKRGRRIHPGGLPK